MPEKPNFVLIPDDPASPPPALGSGILARLRSAAATALNAAASAPTRLLSEMRDAEPPAETGMPPRPRLVFAVKASHFPTRVGMNEIDTRKLFQT
jgi:hypothetical protein